MREPRSFMAALMAGMSLLVMSPSGLRNPAMVQGFWRLVAQYRATRVGAVPTSLGAVLQVPLDGADISCVRAGFTGEQRHRDLHWRNRQSERLRRLWHQHQHRHRQHLQYFSPAPRSREQTPA